MHYCLIIIPIISTIVIGAVIALVYTEVNQVWWAYPKDELCWDCMINRHTIRYKKYGLYGGFFVYRCDICREYELLLENKAITEQNKQKLKEKIKKLNKLKKSIDIHKT